MNRFIIYCKGRIYNEAQATVNSGREGRICERPKMIDRVEPITVCVCIPALLITKATGTLVSTPHKSQMEKGRDQVR